LVRNSGRVLAATDNAAMHSAPAGEPHGHNPHAGSLWRLTLCALGIVFGDIGTSPLYTL
jgi:K+ transporter